MATGWSERVRQVADKEFVQPARRSGTSVKIRFGDLKSRMVKLGFPAGNSNQIATPIESPKFWQPRGLEMCSPKGQRRNNDTVFEFRFSDQGMLQNNEQVETPAERASRLTEKLRGLFREEIMAHGGTKGFVRWVRSRDEDEDGE